MVETTITVAWISLPPNFFGKETIFSIASAVEKSLQVDLVTTNKIRPSCARVKVEVDLKSTLPKWVSVGIRKKSGEITDKWIQIKYDYLLKYFHTCKLQGHNEEECFVLYPELFQEDTKQVDKEKDNNKDALKETKTLAEKRDDFQVPKQRNARYRGGTSNKGVITKVGSQAEESTSYYKQQVSSLRGEQVEGGVPSAMQKDKGETIDGEQIKSTKEWIEEKYGKKGGGNNTNQGKEQGQVVEVIDKGGLQTPSNKAQHDIVDNTSADKVSSTQKRDGRRDYWCGNVSRPKSH